MNRVVARLTDGRVVKGMTADFFPPRDLFHVSAVGAPPGVKPEEVRIQDLKAMFFVKDLAGDPEHVQRNEFGESRPRAERPIRVVFNDGEVLVGTTAGYSPGRVGFFLTPADPDSNIDRCYVATAATREISFL